MEVIFGYNKPRDDLLVSVYLAGPEPEIRHPDLWRRDVVKALTDTRFEGNVFVPLSRNFRAQMDSDLLAHWKLHRMKRADAILFWVARNSNPANDPAARQAIIRFAQHEKIVIGCEATDERSAPFLDLARQYEIVAAHDLMSALAKTVRMARKRYDD